MLSALQRAVTQPASFFRTESRDPGLLQPALVVGAIAVVGVIGSIPTILAVFEALPAGAGVFAAVGFAIGGVFGLITPFITWLIVAVLFFIGTLVVGGDGSFRDLFALVGWGFAPRVIASVVGAIVSFVFVSGTDFSDPQQASQLSQMVATSTIGLVSQGVSVVTYLWAGWIWTHAVANARDVSVRKAGLVVGVVVLLAILVNVASVFLVG